jgi:hypothetical protein
MLRGAADTKAANRPRKRKALTKECIVPNGNKTPHQVVELKNEWKTEQMTLSPLSDQTKKDRTGKRKTVAAGYAKDNEKKGWRIR